MRTTKYFLKIIMALSLALVLLGWRDLTGNTINPNYVQRIKDGQTTKNEITLLFGEPQVIKRTENGLVFTYRSFVDKPPAKPYNPDERQPKAQSDQLFLVDDNKEIKKPESNTQGKILKSTLTIYFKPDGQTVCGHEYMENK